MARGEETEGGNLADYLSILSGTTQNLIGIVVAALATLAVQVLLTNTLGAPRYGIVIVLTQAAFVVSFATRAGMDMAVLRDVAVEIGVDRRDRIRVPVARAATIAGAVSLGAALIFIGAADSILRLFSIDPDRGRWVVEAAALGIPFLALANVWLSATRGLKIMRYTLYVFWAGQPVAWIGLIVLGWAVARTTWMAVLAYSVSWIVATLAAYYFWRRESRLWEPAPLEPGALARLARYAGPRAPAALFSQLLFWTDLFVLTRYASDGEVGIYAAVLRAGQIVVLFLTSVSLMFSPFVADLYSRGEIKRLDGLFKTLTRWTIAATIPAILLLLIVPGPALRVFGSAFSEGQAALLIVLVGQIINIATGSVGFVLIMVGRTGWDLVVYAASLVMNLALAFWLCPRYGMEGAAIANAVTFAASKWARLALVRKFVGIQPYDRHYARLLVPAAAGAAAMLLVSRLFAGAWFGELALTATFGVAAYLLAYFAVGLTPGERRAASGLLAHLRTR